MTRASWLPESPMLRIAVATRVMLRMAAGAAPRAVPLAITLATAAPAFAQAQPSAAEIRLARDYFAKAEKEEAAQQWAPALDHFQKAGNLKMTAGIRYHIAYCEDNLGRLLDAQTDYTAAQDLARTDGNKEVVDAATDALTQLRYRIPTLKVVIPQGVANAEVLIDKKPVVAGDGGYTVMLEPGMHTLDVHAPGRQPYSKSFKIVEREITNVEPPLLPENTTAPTAPPPVVTAPPPEEHHDSHAGGNKTPAILATVGAVALVGGGVGAFVLAGNKASDGKTTCLNTNVCDSGRGAVRTWDAVALGGWVAGAALGAVAVYLWVKPSHAEGGTAFKLQTPRQRAENGAQNVRLVPWGQGFRLEGSF